MSVTHPSGSDLESMNEFYDKKFLRAVTLLLRTDKGHIVPYFLGACMSAVE